MPEPDTKSAPRGDPDPASKLTGSWDIAVVSNSGPVPVVAPVHADPGANGEGDAPTYSRTEGSTPGPERPDRGTQTGATERLPQPTTPEPVTRDGLPCIKGYDILSRLDDGGMGDVYRAMQLHPPRLVALKIVKLERRDRWVALERFQREVNALALLEHPNIVAIYDAGESNGHTYFTMRFVPGGDLHGHRRRFQGNPEACARLIAKVARAIQKLHDHKFVHRDLKPRNILMGEDDEPLIADFGLAKWLDGAPSDSTVEPDAGLTITGGVLGTVRYMAPEQTRGADIARSPFPRSCDIWAIGVILYEVLSGKRPFDDDARHEHSDRIFDRIREDDPPPMPPEVPARLESIVQKCLAKQPADRFHSAAEVADHLEAWLAGQPAPGELPPPKRPRKWPAVVGLVAVLTLVMTPAVYLSRPEAKPPLSFAERLERNGTVWLIRDKGLPIVPVLPGIPSNALTTDGQGVCVLGGRAAQFAELVNEPLPFPVLLEGEVALRGANPSLGHGGFYVGRQVAALPHGPTHVLWKFGAIDKDNQRVENDTVVTADGGLVELFLLNQVTLKASHQPLDTRLQHESRRAFSKDIPLTPDWHPISVVISPDALQGSYHTKPFVRINPEKQLRIFSLANDLPLSTFPVSIGQGIGVFATDADVLFRNLRIARLAPNALQP